MIQVEPITQFDGFGTGLTQGEHFYSQGMSKSQFGIVPGWNIYGDQDEVSLTTLGLGNFFTQGMLNSVNNVAMVDNRLW